MRWLPASGASVAPVRRMDEMRSMMGADREPTRSDGREMEICSLAHLSKLRVKRVSRPEKSPVLSESMEVSSYPVSLSPSDRMRSRSSRERSRTGR